MEYMNRMEYRSILRLTFTLDTLIDFGRVRTKYFTNECVMKPGFSFATRAFNKVTKENSNLAYL